MDRAGLTIAIKDKAMDLGFDLIGVSPIDSFPENQFYKEWLNKGFSGEMKYLERNSEKREDIQNILPGAKSVISCAMNYNTDYPYSIEHTDNTKGWISRYAWGDDYHDTIKNKLQILMDYICSESSHEVESKLYVDTGPVLEKTYGKYAGVGWVGKNTCLINQEIGSWIFLGEIITSLELEYDVPVPDRCGTCTRCIEACPTDAIIEPYILDSRLCISYLTIELKDKIPHELREGVDNNIYGCDICQDVCPWNKRAHISDKTEFEPREGLLNPNLPYLSSLSVDEFRKHFKGSPIKRTKRRGLLRNVMIAMGNSGEKNFLPYISECLKDEEPLVRAHAIWALWKIKGAKSKEILINCRDKENDSIVIDEIDRILSSI
ncbi:MAG: epoxyqueuosine reductase [Thermodesulfobacteriota bacterium]|nr:MAG: epoxyqueuosine reductase [Thermodesulfobacteriota bacterium]